MNKEKIKDLWYYSYIQDPSPSNMIGVDRFELEHVIGSDNKAYIEYRRAKYYLNDDFKTMWFVGKREFLQFLYEAGYVTEKEIFVEML